MERAGSQSVTVIIPTFNETQFAASFAKS